MEDYKYLFKIVLVGNFDLIAALFKRRPSTFRECWRWKDVSG